MIVPPATSRNDPGCWTLALSRRVAHVPRHSSSGLVGRRLRGLEPRAAVARLGTIPGVSLTTAGIIVAEVGVDMSRFPTAHLRSWAGLCPRLDESAGRHGSRRIRKGAPWLKPIL